MSGFWCLIVARSNRRKPLTTIGGVRVRSFFVVFLIAAVVSGFSLANFVNSGIAQNSAVFTISGYILDTTGHGIEGAQIIFNVPDIVPSVY